MRLTRLFRIPRWMHWRSTVRLRDVVIFSLLPLAVAFYFVAAAISDYRNTSQFDDSWSRYSELNTFFVERVSAVRDLPKMWALQRRLTPERLDPGIIRLAVEPGVWNSWQGDPLALMDQWNDATLIQRNNLIPVKLRKRGDNSVHWMTEKKSFTLRTRKRSLFKGYSRLAFSAKTVLHSYVVGRLAHEFDLLAPFTTVAPVFVNEKFYGIFRVSELIDESFLRSHSRMPGNIYRGDNAERGEVYKGLPRGLSVNPYIWDRVAEDHLPSSHADAMLQAFLLDLNGTTFEDHLRVMSWVDRDEISRLLALMLVAGDPIHLSDINNNFWYQDPSTGLLHPIPWDLRLLVLEVLQKRHYRISRIMAELLRNPFVLDGALRVIQEKVADNRLLKTAEHMVSEVYERYREHFEFDRLREPFIPYVGVPDHALDGLRRNIRLLNEWFRDSGVAFQAQAETGVGMILDFETRGFTGSDLQSIVIEGDMKPGQSVRLVADRNRNGVLDRSDQELPGIWTTSQSGGQLTLGQPLALLPGIDPDQPGIKAAPIHYRLFLAFSNNGEMRFKRLTIRPNLTNRLTGEPSTIMDWRSGELIPVTPSWHPWQYPSPRPVEHRLSGKVRLRRTLIIAKNDTLVVDAGTTVEMEPDVSILSRGRVIARGTSEHPITFRRAVENQPWGTIALQGEAANGSIFEHVRFSGGGGAFLERVEYKGMVTVHRAHQVAFKNCELSDNVRSDDALNAVHSWLTIDRCAFRRANSDAIDFDYSFGKITNNRFEDSGNDAIDLMGSAPEIIGNQITGSGDKGVSIGEGSSPFVFNNYIAHSNIGIEVKDRSEPFVLHNTITQNLIGINQYAKNWRYGSGGWAKLVNTLVVENKTDVKSDKNSRLTTLAHDVAATGPITVSTRTGSPVSTDSLWILTQHGIRAPSNSTGQIEDWTVVKPTPPKVMGIFEDDFERSTDGWIGHGGVSRIEKQDQDLQVILARGPGAISRSVDWNLTDPRYKYIVVFELTGRNLRSGRISLLSTDGEMIHPFKIPESLGSYEFVSMELKPAHYTLIALGAEVSANTGRVHLHSYRLYAIPRDDLAS